ncbi:thioredoxin family protein [Marinococcus halotolerans]|uniref:thioredoxin family protein n=1 Tax=Marinococcus halotolerans TaxID=301092 RepID=UPI0003B43867|nr:thioredoxin family protein [Marinococcus halotolerans]
MNDGDHQQDIRDSEASVVLASFWAPWCTPCHRLPYILDKVHQQMKEQVAIFPINVQKSPHLTEEFEVNVLPTLLILRQGHILERLEGLHSSPEIIDYLKPHIQR